MTYELYCDDVLDGLRRNRDIKDVKLVLSSPPYNIGKAYETRTAMEVYADWQSKVIDEILPRMTDDGVFCWQVGTYVNKGEIYPLDYLFIPMLMDKGLHFQNRIIWHFNSGLHAKTRFSGRHDTILLFSKSKEFVHDNRLLAPIEGDLPVDIEDMPEFQAQSLRSDIWDIPTVNHNHPEKIPGAHPCQFPVALAERVILGATQPGDLVFDPFSGMATTGVAAIIHGRRFKGIERDPTYCEVATRRLDMAEAGAIKWRPWDRPIDRPKMTKEPEVEDEPSTLAP